MASESGVESMFPPLPLEEWDESKETLHRYAQIVGKVRLVRAPFRNHWWQVPLYVTHLAHDLDVAVERLLALLPFL